MNIMMQMEGVMECRICILIVFTILKTSDIVQNTIEIKSLNLQFLFKWPNLKQTKHNTLYLHIKSIHLFWLFFFCLNQALTSQKTEKLWNTVKDLWVTFHMLIGS